MRLRKVLTSAAAVVGVALVAMAVACREPASEPPEQAGTIRLGMLAPLTGRNALFGIAMVNAAKMAVREANDGGGVLGRKVELITVDDACDPGTAVLGANALVADDIAVSVGGYCSSATVPTMKIFRAAGIPMIVPLSNSTDLLAAGYDSVFLLSGTAAAEGAFAIQQIHKLGGRRLAVVHDGTTFPLSLADATEENAAAGGGRLTVVTKQVLTQGAPSYARIADGVLAARADTVYFTGYYTDARQLVVDLRARGYDGLIVVGDAASTNLMVQGLTHYQLRDLYGTSLLLPEFMPEAADWATRYRTAYGSPPPPTTIESYDAVVLALDAVRRAGSVDRAKLLTAIRSTRDASLLSGPVSFTREGARENPRFLLLRARAGGFELVAEAGVN